MVLFYVNSHNILHDIIEYFLCVLFNISICRLPALNRSSSESPHNFHSPTTATISTWTSTGAKSKSLLRSQTEIIPGLHITKTARTKSTNKFKTGAIVASSCLKSAKKLSKSMDCTMEKALSGGGNGADINGSPICGRITLRKIKSKSRKKSKATNVPLLVESSSLQLPEE